MFLDNIDLDIGYLLLLVFAAVAVLMLIRSFRPDAQVREIRTSTIAHKPVVKVAPTGTLEAKDKRAVKKLGVKLIAAAILIFVMMDVLIVTKVYERFTQKHVEPVQQRQPGSRTPHSGQKQNEAIPAKAVNSAAARPNEATEGAAVATVSPLIIKPGLVNLSITQIFNPVKMKIGAVSRPGSDLLSEEKPAAIHSEPAYRGQPLYGYFALGVGGQARFYFAFDDVRSTHPVLYLDRNRNGDLTDDGPPLNNKGSGRFATPISIPFALINPELDALGDFKFWFYTNKGLWPKKRASHYSRLQLTTELKIGEKWFHVWLAERGYNDADFSNDGLYIDINQDDRIDTGTEHFATGEPVEIDGNKYIFLINNG